MKTRHLDLGCGFTAKNPYNASELFGCDIRYNALQNNELNCTYTQVNLFSKPIPHPDNYFDSVSAYDFLEHVPRQSLYKDGTSDNPFIKLMNEVYRVLKPNGIFLASSPAYPHHAAFSDPTHVNFITQYTHTYFIGNSPTAQIYGFNGKFHVIKAILDTPHNTSDPSENQLRKRLRRLHRIITGKGLSHIYWELSAIK